MKNVKIEVTVKVTQGIDYGYELRTLAEATVATKSDVVPGALVNELNDRVREAADLARGRLASAAHEEASRIAREEAQKTEREVHVS